MQGNFLSFEQPSMVGGQMSGPSSFSKGIGWMRNTDTSERRKGHAATSCRDIARERRER